MKTVRWAGIALLVFLAVSAIAGSVPMISSPHGEPLRLPQTLLQHSPFGSYLVPGIILLLANGLLAIWVLCLTLAQFRRHGLWMTLQGCVLFGWLAIECIMLRFVVWIHYLYGAVALALIGAGLLLRHAEISASFGDGI